VSPVRAGTQWRSRLRLDARGAAEDPRTGSRQRVVVVIVIYRSQRDCTEVVENIQKRLRMGFRYCLVCERISRIVDCKLFSRTVVRFEFSLKHSCTFSQGVV
jgi:hypothetical protein